MLCALCVSVVNIFVCVRLRVSAAKYFLCGSFYKRVLDENPLNNLSVVEILRENRGDIL